MGFTTRDRVKRVLGIPAGITYHDARIDDCVEFANDYILGQVGQTTSSVLETYTEYPDIAGEGCSELLLKHSPVGSIVALTNGSAAVAAADYVLDDDIGRIRLSGASEHFTTSRVGVVVTYTAGFSDSTVPKRLIRAADLIAAAQGNTSSHAGKRVAEVGGQKYELDEEGIPVLARMILAEFVDVHHF